MSVANLSSPVPGLAVFLPAYNVLILISQLSRHGVHLEFWAVLFSLRVLIEQALASLSIE